MSNTVVKLPALIQPHRIMTGPQVKELRDAITRHERERARLNAKVHELEASKASAENKVDHWLTIVQDIANLEPSMLGDTDNLEGNRNAVAIARAAISDQGKNPAADEVGFQAVTFGEQIAALQAEAELLRSRLDQLRADSVEKVLGNACPALGVLIEGRREMTVKEVAEGVYRTQKPSDGQRQEVFGVIQQLIGVGLVAHGDRRNSVPTYQAVTGNPASE